MPTVWSLTDRQRIFTGSPLTPPTSLYAHFSAFSSFQSELSDHIPVFKASVAETRLIGRMTVGNKNGLLLPNTTTDQGEMHSRIPPCEWTVSEMMHIRNCIPDEVVVQRIDERLSALGNCIACNDYVALVHKDIDKVHRVPAFCI